MNATTQINAACLHHHLDTISTVDHNDLGYIEALLDESEPPPASVRDSLAGAHDGQLFRFPPGLN